MYYVIEKKKKKKKKNQPDTSQMNEKSKYLFIFINIYYWDTSTSSQVSNCDGVVLEICLDQKLQWPQKHLNGESLPCQVVT